MDVTRNRWTLPAGKGESLTIAKQGKDLISVYVVSKTKLRGARLRQSREKGDLLGPIQTRNEGSLN